MAITYLTLTADDQADILVNTLKAQERDHFCHMQNVSRYQEMLKSGVPDPEFAQRISDLLGTEQIALARVESTLLKTADQISAAAVDVAATLSRLQAKEEAALGFAKIGG